MLVFFAYWCCRKKGGGNAWTTIKDCIGPICRECYRDPPMSFEGRVEAPDFGLHIWGVFLGGGGGGEGGGGGGEGGGRGVEA